MMRTLHILYFASIAEQLGRDAVDIDVPASVGTVGGLIDFLSGQDAAAQSAFADRTRIRCALDQSFAPLDAALGDAKEVAFFPPVTGG